ncbi:AAA family ATPase [Alicyclobacillus sp. SP_1]|uniref:AAA family ATPase n=1 Tax=Alicyclobacillus sp. SP_1 TaxID=2942475 RepID=UPI0021571A95|nr:AAA family ATPase [Alicyclobacillus sp. SP_1]
MKITGFHANNYLSFRDFHLEDIDQNLNILVGPNGAGKSNVLYAIEQVAESASDEVSIEEFRLNCNFNDVDDFAEIALDVEFNDENEQSLLAHYICYSLFSQSGLQNLLASGTNLANQLNRDKLRIFVDYMEKQVLGSPSLLGVYAGKICVKLSNALHPSFSVYYRFQSHGQEFFWYLHGSYSNVIGINRFKNRSESWSQQEIWNAWMKSMGEDTTMALKQWLTNERDEIPQIAFDFTSIISQGDTSSLYSLGGMNNHMGSDPELPSYMYLRKSLGDINESTSPIQSASVFRHIFRDTVIKTANIHVEPRKKFDYTEWDNPSSSLLDGSGLALHLFRLKNGSKSEREEFRRICNGFSKLTNGRKLDVQLKNVVEYTDSLTTFRNPLPRIRLKPIQKSTSTVPTRESKATLHLEIITLDQHEREFPISRSGAGIFELAFLCAVLSVSKSHIILLDEPGVHVHPRIQRQLAMLFEQAGAQIFVATHSPYLISSKTLKNTRRIHMDAGCSKVSSAFRPSDNPNYRLKSEQAFERNTNRANALFSDLAILVDGESEYHALPIWFTKYLEKKKNGIEESLSYGGMVFEDFNISLLHVDGKKNNPSYLRFVTAFDVRWMLLCDGDSLGANDNIVRQLKEFEIDIEDGMSFCETKKELWNKNVFVLGHSELDNFESIEEVKPFLDQAKEKFGNSKARQAQWIAEQTGCPEVLIDIFDRVIQLLPNV